MSDHYEGIGHLSKVVEQTEGPICLPAAVIEGMPYRLANIPYDEVAFASRSGVTRDLKTGALIVDTHDIIADKPYTEWELRNRAAVMRVLHGVGETALEGYLVDYRYMGVTVWRDLALEDGIDNPVFQKHKELYGTVFPLGIVLNMGCAAEYHGHPDFISEAEEMMRSVDTFVASGRFKPHKPTLSVDNTVVKPPKKIAGAGAVEAPGAEIVLFKPKTELAEVQGMNESLLKLATSIVLLGLLSGDGKRVGTNRLAIRGPEEESRGQEEPYTD